MTARNDWPRRPHWIDPRFGSPPRRCIGRAFGAYTAKAGLCVWACAIMPDHVHLAFGAHRIDPKGIVNKLKGAATSELVENGIHPFQHLKPIDGPPPKCFAQDVKGLFFLDPEDVAWNVEYVENNPIKAGLPAQEWDFVQCPKWI